VNRTLKFTIGIAVIVCAVGTLMWTAVDQTKMYMVTVAEYLDAREAYAGTTVRIAGRVAESTMNWDASSRELRFTLDDMNGEGNIQVHYAGLLPDMFAEGRDVVVQGLPTESAIFEATTVLTSCPSKYEPDPEDS
jgi:cytochrome c-type biogenesis protein CcmE